MHKTVIGGAIKQQKRDDSHLDNSHFSHSNNANNVAPFFHTSCIFKGKPRTRDTSSSKDAFTELISLVWKSHPCLPITNKPRNYSFFINFSQNSSFNSFNRSSVSLNLIISLRDQNISVFELGVTRPLSSSHYWIWNYFIIMDTFSNRWKELLHL